jgi:hypothetical protein
VHICIPIDSELQWEKGIWKSFPFERIQLNRFIVTCGFEPSFRSTPIACRRNGWIFNLFGNVFYSVCDYISTNISHHTSNSFFSICVTYFTVIITYSFLREKLFRRIFEVVVTFLFEWLWFMAAPGNPFVQADAVVQRAKRGRSGEISLSFNNARNSVCFHTRTGWLTLAIGRWYLLYTLMTLIQFWFLTTQPRQMR